MSSEKEYTKEELIKLAYKLVQAKIPFGQLDKDQRYLKNGNKGNIGQLIEDCWFGQKPHSDPDPDFKAAKVELKVSPYYTTTNGVSAKERLVCDIINFAKESQSATFFDSSFWHKCENILLLSYYHAKNKDAAEVQKKDMFVDHFALLEGFPEEDLAIIIQDWETIIKKIRAGKAHEISEGDTKYLGACTKGSTLEKSFVQQPYSDIPAKQRAYSLKATYMTRLLRKYIFGEEESPHVIKNINVLKEESFEDLVINKLMRFKNWTEADIASKAGITWSKDYYARLTNYMLDLGNTKEQCEEFQSANIKVRSIHVKHNGNVVESVSFPAFRFLDLITQEWENSDLYNDVVSARFLFVIYREDQNGITRLETAKFWNMPNEDAEEIHRVWLKTIEVIKRGAGLRKAMWGKKEIIKNDFPGLSDSYVAHVRPHASKSAYLLKDGTSIGDIKANGDQLPNGEWMSKQCFWLNASYVENVIKGLLKDKQPSTVSYELHQEDELQVAENSGEYDESLNEKKT